MKHDSGSSKRHDVRSIIGNPSRYHPMQHHLEMLQDARARYEESLKGRPSAVVSTPGSISRGSPVIITEPGKAHHSPLAYEDHKAAHRAAFAGHPHRCSPVSSRESAARQHESKASLFIFSGELSKIWAFWHNTAGLGRITPETTEDNASRIRRPVN